MSWIALTDVLGAFDFMLADTTLDGAVNLTAPNPVTNAAFSRTLADVLGRPAIATVPEFAVKLLYGKMGEETVIAGQRVLPKKLLAAGFRFQYPELESALRHELGR
jgi:NAD dependent epimerase/dehydratase family enzyme